jgi:hypothetical protein
MSMAGLAKLHNPRYVEAVKQLAAEGGGNIGWGHGGLGTHL